MPEEQKVVVVVKPEGQEQEKTGKVEVKESEPASQPAAAVEKVVEKIVEATADAKAKEEVEPAAKVGEIKAQEPLAATAAPKVDVEAQKTTDNRQQEPAVAPVVAVKEEAAPIIQRDFAAAPQTAEAVVAPVVESTPPPPPPPAPPTETVVPTVTQPLTRTFTTPAGQPVTVFEHPDPTLVTTEPLPVVVVPEQKHVTYAEPVATTVEPLVVAVPAPEAQQVVAATPVVVSAPPPVVEAAPPGTAVIVPAAAVVEEQKPLVVEQTDGTIKETAAMAVLPTTPVVVAAPPPPPPTLVAEVPVVPVVVAPSPPPTAQPIPANVTAIQPPVRLEQPQIIPVPGSTQELPSVAQTLAAASSPTMAPAMNELPILALPVGIFAAHVAAAETRLVMEEKLPSFSGMDWSIRGENSDDVVSQPFLSGLGQSWPLYRVILTEFLSDLHHRRPHSLLLRAKETPRPQRRRDLRFAARALLPPVSPMVPRRSRPPPQYHEGFRRSRRSRQPRTGWPRKDVRPCGRFDVHNHDVIVFDDHRWERYDDDHDDHDVVFRCW